MDNHLLSNLKREALSFVELDETAKPLLADDATFQYLAQARHASREPGFHELVLTSARAEIPVFAAVARAWDLQGRNDPDLVVLITKQHDAASVARRHKFPRTSGPPSGQHNMLGIQAISRRIKRIDKALTPKKGHLLPRLVITNYYDENLHTALGGTYVKAIFIDGRTIRLDDLDLPSKTPIVHHLVSKLQATPGKAKLHEPIKLVANEDGILASPIVTPAAPVVYGIEDPAPRMWGLLDQLRRQQGTQVFTQEARNIAWFLNALTVGPDQLTKQYVHQVKRQGHAVYGILELLHHIEQATEDEAVQTTMAEFLYEAHEACKALDAQCPKQEQIRALVTDHPGALVVVRSRSNRDGLQQVINAEGLDARVISWRDNADWMPHNGLVIFASPPSPERFWLLAPHCQVGRETAFLFTPKEVATLRRTLVRNRLATKNPGKGTLQRALTDVKWPEPDSPDPVVPMAPDLLDWLDSIHDRKDGGTGWDGNFTGGNMLCFTIGDGDRYYIGLHTLVAVFRPSGVVEVPAHEVEVGDVILLPTQHQNMSLKDAFITAFEAQEPQHRVRVEQWKTDVVEAAREQGIETPGDLCRKLTALGGMGLNPKNIDETFYSWETISASDEYHLVRATGYLLEKNIDQHELRNSISRLRTIRRLAGKVLKRYASLSYINSDEDLHQRFESSFSLTHADLQSLVRPCPVRHKSGPIQAPERINKFLSETVNQ